jgi:DNA-binding beta-propeller fold protein YncE
MEKMMKHESEPNPNANPARWVLRLAALLTASLASLNIQGCLETAGSADAELSGRAFPQTLFAAQEGSLASFDLATGTVLAGTIADVKSPTDMQALEDGTVLVNLSGSNEILIVDGKTMLLKARMPSSGSSGLKPVHSYITPEIAGKRYWVTLNDGDGSKASNSARFLDLDTADAAKYLKAAGEVALGLGHHKAAFSPDQARMVISNIGDCDDIMSVFDYSDPADIRRISTLDAAGSGFDGSDKNHICDQTKVAGIAPSPHGCAAAKGNGHALCNETGTGAMVAVDLDAAVPGFKLIPTHGSGAGYTAAHPGGRDIYSLQSKPNESSGGVPCQVGQLAIVDMLNDSLVGELPLLYKGGGCADSLKGTPAAGASPSHTLFSLDGSKAFINVASGADESVSRVSMQLILDAADPAHPKQEASLAIGSSFGSHGETLTGDGKYLIVANNKDASVSVIDVAAGTVAKTFPIGNAGKTLATFGTAEGPSHQVGPFH